MPYAFGIFPIIRIAIFFTYKTCLQMAKFLFPLLLLVSTLSSGQVNPPIEVIAKKFFTLYEMPTYSSRILSFESRPDGYYVRLLNVGTPEVEKRERFYDLQSDRYLALKLFADQFESPKDHPSLPTQESRQTAEAYIRQIGDFEKSGFDRQPFYGYPGWYNDAINYWETKRTLNDDELHALARAYSTAAMALLADYSNYSLDEERFQLQAEIPAMNSAQLKQYLLASNKCLSAYKMLKERNPDFMTPIGPARSKYANERMNVFLTLLYFQGEQEALAILEEDLYEPYFLTNARNYLRSCPKDAIVIAYGDSDTYTLLYVQATEGFRTDVIVANTSLMVIERYRKMVLAGPLGATQLKSNLPPFYSQLPIKVWAKSANNPDSTIAYQQLLKLLSREDRYYISGNTWTLPLPYDQVAIELPENIAYLNPESKNTSAYWQPFINKGYQFSDGYFLLDLLAANHWERPLCFLPTVLNNELLPWQKHLAWNGWVYLVVPDQLADNRLATGIYHHTDSTFQLWQEAMVYDTITTITPFDKLPFYQHQIKSAGELLKQLIADGKMVQAQQFANQLPLRYPNTIRPWDGQWIAFLPMFRQCKANKAANNILKTIEENVRENRIEFFGEEERWLLLQRVREMKE
jgi:hypothetical protein